MNQLLTTAKIMNSFKINTLSDLPKLKIFMENTNEKLNVSAVARKVEVDRRSAKKYIEGFQKKRTWKKHLELIDLIQSSMH